MLITMRDQDLNRFKESKVLNLHELRIITTINTIKPNA